MFDRFSEDARKTMTAARQAALEFKHDYIGTEHMLLGIVSSDRTVAAVALRQLGVDAALIRSEVTKIVRAGTCESTGQLPFTPRGKRVLELSLEEAQMAGHHHIGTGHLLLGLFREGEGIGAQVFGRAGIAAQVLRRAGITIDKARPVVMDAIRTATEPGDGPPAPSPAIGESLRTVMAEACAEAARLHQSPVEAEHALVAMLEGDGIAARVLRELGATPDGVRKRVGELRRSQSDPPPEPGGR